MNIIYYANMVEHAILWPVLIGSYCLLGLGLFEWSYFKLRVMREPNEARDARYPAFRRFDAVKWRRWKFYPGALTLLPLRVILAVLIGLICFITV
jgi:hypothetical protein